MTHIIRKTQRADISALQDVERSASQLFKSVPKYEWIAEAEVMRFEDHTVFVDQGLSWTAEDNTSKMVTGFILAELHQNDLYIVELSVRQSHQKRGIGSMLLQTVLDEAVRLKAQSITLTTFKHIPWNAPYYSRLGFDIILSENLPDYLQLKFENEIAGGFERDQRCAMRKR